MSNKRCHCLMTKKLKKIIHINKIMLQLVDFLNESRGQAIINRAGNRPYDATQDIADRKNILKYERHLFKDAKNVKVVCDRVNSLIQQTAKQFGQLQRVLSPKDFDCRLYLVIDDNHTDEYDASFAFNNAVGFEDAEDFANAKAYVADVNCNEIDVTPKGIQQAVKNILKYQDIIGAQCLVKYYKYDEAIWPDCEEPLDGIQNDKYAKNFQCLFTIEPKNADAKEAFMKVIDYLYNKQDHINPLNSIKDFNYNEYNSPGEASDFTCREYDDKYGFILFDCTDSKIDDRPLKVFMNSLKNFK